MATFESAFNGLRGGLCPARTVVVAGRSFGRIRRIRRPAVGCARQVPSPLPVEPSTPSAASVKRLPLLRTVPAVLRDGSPSNSIEFGAVLFIKPSCLSHMCKHSK